MTLRDFKDRMISLFGKPQLEGSSRPDGGTSCYRPMRKRKQEEPAEESAPAMQQSELQIPYAHTGFTGMNPPAGYGQSAGYFRHEEEAPAQQPAYGGAFGNPGNAAGAYGYGADAGTGYGGRFSPSYGAGAGNSYGNPPAYGNSGSWSAPAAPAAPQDNISYMPGVYAPDAGNSYTHVEHIMIMTSLKTCYEAIECMKNGETLILTLDAIANENEALRCQDMLAGAAFTLGCNVRMLNSARIVLIAPESVKILPEQAPGRPGAVPPMFNVPQPAPQPQQEPAAPPRRERRTGQRTAEYEAARRGQSPYYNPYTGNMPAAAGDYSRFGGYGY